MMVRWFWYMGYNAMSAMKRKGRKAILWFALNTLCFLCASLRTLRYKKPDNKA
jgi:hypothetical protein